MTRVQRRRHRLIWFVLAPLLGIVLLWGVIDRLDPVPTSATTTPSNERPR